MTLMNGMQNEFRNVDDLHGKIQCSFFLTVLEHNAGIRHRLK